MREAHVLLLAATGFTLKAATLITPKAFGPLVGRRMTAESIVPFVHVREHAIRSGADSAHY